MKIWLVEEISVDEAWPVGVFSTEAAAQDFVTAQSGDDREFVVSDWELDSPSN